MFSVFVPSDSSLKKAVSVDLKALPENAVWIDMVKPTPEEDHAVEGLAGIAVPTREDMQEIEISSRLYIENGWKSRSPACLPGSALRSRPAVRRRGPPPRLA
jgi:magnesium transporter